MVEKLPGSADREARTPEGSRIYAVGDIHGRVDLLRRLHKRIADDAAGADGRLVLIYLGDYVDRGADSRQVIDLLLNETPAGFETVTLKGNHEEMMTVFLTDESVAERWILNGGDATLASYGVGAAPEAAGAGGIRALQQDFRDALPDAHLGFLLGLSFSHVEGGYLFVHAGVRPGVAAEDQKPQDLMWIREPFLSSEADHGYCVVHGHTIVDAPEFHANRIAIDTGAYFSSRLTCLVLDGAERRVIQT